MTSHNKEIYEISKLSKNHKKKDFNSGSETLDTYIKVQASQDIKKNVSVAYALTLSGSTEVIGYYTLSTISIDASEIPDNAIKNLPRYPLLPGLLLGRLAVDINHQRKGIGAHLLIDALKRTSSISNQVGIIALIVDAKDAAAANFYKKYEFIEFPSNKLKLFLPTATINELITKYFQE